MSTPRIIQSIQPRSIQLLPVNVGIVLEANIRKYSFLSAEEELPIVRIAQIDQKNYAINHHDVVLACKQSNKEIRCTVEPFQNLSDIMIEHFRDVLSNDVINTPAIYSMVDSLQEKTKKPKSDILKFLGIDSNQYGKLLIASNGKNNNISEMAVTKLESLVTELSKRKSIIAIQASVPQYILEKISRMSDVKDQLSLIQFIQLDLNKKNDSRLFWMTPEQIDSVIQMIRQNSTHAENKREESTVAEFVDIKDIGKQKNSTEVKEEEEDDDDDDTTKEELVDKKSITEKSKNKKQQQHANKSKTKQKTKPPKISKKTKQILETMPNLIVIPDQNGEPEILVDKKNGTVSKVENTVNKNIIKTNPIPSKRLYSVPLDVVKFLKIEENDCIIRHKNISGTDALESFVKSQNDKTLRFSIFWNEQ